MKIGSTIAIEQEDSIPEIQPRLSVVPNDDAVFMLLGTIRFRKGALKFGSSEGKHYAVLLVGKAVV